MWALDKVLGVAVLLVSTFEMVTTVGMVQTEAEEKSSLTFNQFLNFALFLLYVANINLCSVHM